MKKEVNIAYEKPNGINAMPFFIRVKRSIVPVPALELDSESVTEQGKAQSVQKLFNDFVLGRLDPSQLVGGTYDPDGSDEVDPFNNFGVTFEQMSEIEDRGKEAKQELKRRKKAEPAAPAAPANPPAEPAAPPTNP